MYIILSMKKKILILYTKLDNDNTNYNVNNITNVLIEKNHDVYHLHLQLDSNIILNNNKFNNMSIFKYSNNLKTINDIRNEIVNKFGYPHVIFGFNNDSSYIGRQLFLFSYIYYFTSGIDNIFRNNRNILSDIDNNTNIIIDKNIYFSDKTFCNNDLTLSLFKKLYDHNSISNNIIDFMKLFSIKNGIDEELKIIKFFKRKRRILLTSTQYPGNGGAATNIYKIVNLLRSFNFNAMAIYFEGKGEYNYNHDKYNIVRPKTYNEQQECINILGGKPDIIFSKNWVAPTLSKKMFPKIKNCYLVSGSIHGTVFANNNIFLLDSFKKSKKKMEQIVLNDIHAKRSHPKEKLIIKDTDIIILNSYLTNKIFYKYYYKPIYNIKQKCIVSDTSNILIKKSNHHKLYEKTNDILFVVSKLYRKVKNYQLLLDIILDKRLDKYNKIIIGKDYFKNLDNTLLNINKEIYINNLIEEINSLIFDLYGDKCNIKYITENITIILNKEKNVGKKNEKYWIRRRKLKKIYNIKNRIELKKQDLENSKKNVYIENLIEEMNSLIIDLFDVKCDIKYIIENIKIILNKEKKLKKKNKEYWIRRRKLKKIYNIKNMIKLKKQEPIQQMKLQLDMMNISYKKTIDCLEIKKLFKKAKEEMKKKKKCKMINSVPNDKINEYYKKSKILLITSFFDSSPNVLNEALNNNCDVITSKNIGSYEYLADSNIINNYNDKNEWISKIINKLNKK